MGTRPSKLLRISGWASRITGMPDMWTAFQLDNAVMVWGRYVENRLHELDEQRRPKYTLEQLLDLEPKLPALDIEVPAWGAPIPEELRRRAQRRTPNQAGSNLLNLLKAKGA